MRVHTALYTTALAVSVTSLGLSIAGLLTPNWVHFRTPSKSPVALRSDFGLFQRCDSSSFTGDTVTCRRFPVRSQDCERTVGRSDVEVMEKRKRLGQTDDEPAWSFCESWETAGYAQQISLIFGAGSILASFIVLLGGRVKRENGWRVVSGLMGLQAVCLILATSLVAHEFNTDDRFYYGSSLGQGFIESTTAWALNVVVVGALILVGVVGLREDDYERIAD